MRLCRVRILTMRMGRKGLLRGEPAYVKTASALHLRPHTAAFSFHRKRSPVSLRLGHARALTRPRRVIHSPRAASLPPRGRQTKP